MPYLAGVTNTPAGLKLAGQVLQNGQRPDAQDILILLSDGRSNVDEDIVQTVAQELKDLGTTIFSVGRSLLHVLLKYLMCHSINAKWVQFRKIFQDSDIELATRVNNN